jgi:hypothetical protein
MPRARALLSPRRQWRSRSRPASSSSPSRGWSSSAGTCPISRRRCCSRPPPPHSVAGHSPSSTSSPVRRPLRPRVRAVLTEIHLCTVYSCQESLRDATAAARAQARGQAPRALPAGGRSRRRRRRLHGGGGGGGGGSAARPCGVMVSQRNGRPAQLTMANAPPPRPTDTHAPVAQPRCCGSGLACSAQALHWCGLLANLGSGVGALATVSRPFPSWNRPILTDIYLCHACSCHEIEDGNGRAGLQRGDVPQGQRGL